MSRNPFLLIIRGCSDDIQCYLKIHLDRFIKDQNQIENIFKEEYVAVVIKWIIENEIWCDKNKIISAELYKYVFKFLHDQSFHQINKELVYLKTNAIVYLETIIFSYDNEFHQANMNYNVSDEIQYSLIKLFNTSLTKTISIRAGICLFFAEQSSRMLDQIVNWFGKKWQLTSDNEYNILLSQQILYHWIKFEYNVEAESHSTELIDTFVRELKNHLDNKCNNYYNK